MTIKHIFVIGAGYLGRKSGRGFYQYWRSAISIQPSAQMPTADLFAGRVFAKHSEGDNPLYFVFSGGSQAKSLTYYYYNGSSTPKPFSFACW